VAAAEAVAEAVAVRPTTTTSAICMILAEPAKKNSAPSTVFVQFISYLILLICHVS
jgi:hypothetical protein